MTPEEIKLNITAPGFYTVKFGNLPQDREPIKVDINGNIDSVVNYLKARVEFVDEVLSSVTVDEEKGKIILTVDEHSYFKSTIIGALTPHHDFVKWGINTEKQYSSLDLAQMIKMNRFMFPSTTQAMELVAVFQTLKAKVQREIELSDDKRGNKTNNQSQVVLNMSIPAGFSLKIPMFKGFNAVHFEVEISINAETLNIQLVSPAANDIVSNFKKEILQNQVDQIKEFKLSKMPIIFC